MSKNLIERLQQELPELCTDQDLIRVGLFSSPQCLFQRRKKGCAPPFFQFGRRVRYPKETLIKWVQDAYRPEGKMEGSFGCD